MSATITEGTLPLNFPSPEDLYCMAIYCTYENAKNNIPNFLVYPQHLKEEHSNVHYFVTGNGNFFNALEEHKWKVKSSLK